MSFESECELQIDDFRTSFQQRMVGMKVDLAMGSVDERVMADQHNGKERIIAGLFDTVYTELPNR